MASDDAGTQYVPLNKLKIYSNNGLVNNILRKLNFSSQFSLTENPGTDSVDIDIIPPEEPEPVEYALDDLTDVTITTPSTNQVIQYNGTNFVNATLGAGPTSLDGLSDVVITGTPTNGQIIQHNGTEWANVSPAAVSLSLDNLTDVVITTPADDQFLRYNGTNFVNEVVTIPTLPAAREDLCAQFGTSGLDNASASYVDMVWNYTSQNGSSSAAGTKAITTIDFTGKTQYKVVMGVLSDAGSFSYRIVNDALVTDVLHAFTSVATGTHTSALTTLPGWCTGVKTLRLQGLGSGTADLGIPHCSVYLK